MDCWHCYDENFEPAQSKNQASESAEHVKGEKKDPEANSVQASAYLTHQDDLQVPADLESQAWFADSGATHHLTHNRSLLQNKQSYSGVNKVLVGNGQRLNIDSVGLANIKTPSLSHSNLVLKHLLHVPKITRNLLSVSKFAQDNNVFFEFHANTCFIKSQVSKDVLLEGFLDTSGLYSFSS